LGVGGLGVGELGVGGLSVGGLGVGVECPAHGRVCDVASPTEDSVVVVAIEIQDPQTAMDAFGSDTVADSAGDVDPTHAAGKAAVNGRIARPPTPQLSSRFNSRETHARTLLPAA
jgi:hypothetical protein